MTKKVVQLPLDLSNVVPFPSRPRKHSRHDYAWCWRLARDLIQEFSGLDRIGLHRNILAQFIRSMPMPATEKEVAELTRLLVVNGARAPANRNRSGGA